MLCYKRRALLVSVLMISRSVVKERKNHKMFQFKRIAGGRKITFMYLGRTV